jgi:acetolactate synthase-1/2/3 large subunit
MKKSDLTSVTGADLLVKSLLEIEVDTVFCITGAGNLAIVDALARDKRIKVVFSHHEQAAVMEAQGYSRVSGKLGVALVTTGGGAANTLTGVLSAYLDSIPILLVSGNESSFHCANPFDLRAYGVQGFDSCAVLAPVTKSSTRINSVEEVSLKLHESYQISMQDRKGPTHIDFPMDLQRKHLGSEKLEAKKEVKYTPRRLEPQVAERLNAHMANAKRPLFYFGNGIRNPETIAEVYSLIKKTGIPYIVSWSAVDLFPEADLMNVGRVGIYGDRHANILLQKSDLIITIGTRLAIPQIGYDKKDFGRKAEKWVIEVDKTECAKFEGLGWNILNIDALTVVKSLNDSELHLSNLSEWHNECSRVKKIFPRGDQLGPAPEHPASQIHSGDVIDFLNVALESNAIIGTDVGAALLTGHYMYEHSGERRFFTSQGLGEMGFGLPGSIGAHFADTTRQVVCLNTDGAMMFNLQELQVVKEHKIPLKLFVFNNFGYSMIKISQENLFEGRIAGSTSESGISFPDFNQVASTFGFGHTLIKTKNELEKAIPALNSPHPEIIEIIMDPKQRYFPRLATNKVSDGTFISPPLEDLDPKIDLSLLEQVLGYKAHENSYKARGLL